jgi:hypothetical protein
MRVNTVQQMIRKMCITFVIASSLIAIATARPQYELRKDTTQKDQIPLADGSMALKTTFVVGDQTKTRLLQNLDVTLVYDSRTRLVWWAYQLGNSMPAPREWMTQWTVATSTDGRSLVGFTLLTSVLRTRISTLVAQSESESQAKVLSAVANTSTEMVAGADPLSSSIPLIPVLGREFFFDKGSTRLDTTARLRRVTSTTAGWQVVLAGRDYQSATVILSPDFRVLRSEVKRD